MQDFKNRISYLEKLKRRREEIQRQIDSTPEPPSLEERVLAWYNALNDSDKQRAFKMDELTAIFKSTPQKTAKILWKLQWSRRRAYRDNAPTCRFWDPPGQKEVAK